MSFEAHITKMDERPVPKLWLAKPDFTIIERINGVSNLSAKMNYMNENEISFDVNSHLFDEFTNEQYRNPTIEKMRNKYLIKMTYNNQTEWFIIENFSKTSDDKDYVPTIAKYIGSELDKKWVGDIEEIGVTPAQLFNKFLPAVAPNWSIRSIDEKIANVKREYTTSDASISTLIEEVCKAIDAVVVFHNRDRQFSLVHRDNAGKFKGLKVKEATYLKGFTDEQNSENLTTRLVLFGKDGLTINGVNPAGTDYIEDFSYYMKPFRRDSERNVLEHSDYMSDALCHALLDFEEYFNNKTDDYEKLSEQYTNLLKEQLEEEFKLTEITAIKQRLEDRVELLKPQGNYTEKRILGNTSFDFKYNTRYIMVIQNNGTTARLTLNGEEQIVAGGQSTYFKVHTPPQATLDDPQIRHTLQVLSASPNLIASLSTASEDDFAEQDILEIEKKFNIYKYRELYDYQVGILASVERKIKEYDNQRQSINHSLAVDTFFPPALVKERENFINWGVWREEDHTDAKELLEDGLKQLKEHNNVERTVTVSLIDFIQSLEDKDNWDKLSAGDKIQFSNKIYDANMEAFISELNINFDNHDVSVTLSNIIDLKERSRGIAQKMASFVSTAGKVNMQKSQLEDQLNKSNQVIALLEGEWDANKRRITAANETVSIDNRGIIVTSPSHPNEMLVAVAGVIAISNDGGETFKQAINTRGVVAERLIGKVLIGTELVMENDAGTFRFDNEGVRINASNFHLIADDGEDYFDTLMRRLQQEVVTTEEKISEEIKQQRESLKSEINDVDQSLMDYTAGLINALADGLLTEQEIHSLKLQLNMLEADYSQVARRVRPILFDSALDPVIQEELYVSYYRLDEDYQTLVSFIRSLEEPTEVPQETIDNIITLLKRFKPAIEELVAMIETSLTNTQRNRIANAEYNSNTFAENLANDLNDEISDLNDSLKGLNDSLEDALSDGIITTVEKSQLSDALMRFESEKQDVDNRFHNTYNHAHIAGTTNQVSLQTAKTAYNSAYNTLIAKVKQILNMENVSHAIVEEYKALYQEFTTAVVAYSEEYERAVEFIQKGYADTAEGEAKKYTDGLRIEVEADVKDIQDNIVEFETDVYGAFKDGIITEQERNRLGIHHDMLEKEKSDLIERYDTIITSDYLQGFYDVEQLVATRSLYGQVHADLLLALELAMMDSKITKEESQEATRLFDLYVQRLTQFSKELELAIAALGESKAVAHTNEQLNNYMSLTVFNDEIAMLQAEIDGHIMTWYYDHEPTLSTLPASEWKDDKTRNAHVGDLFYHESEGFAFRFMRKSGGGYEWQLIKDTEVTKALSDAQNALDLADDKRRVFVAQPTPPYDIGDLWIKGDGELMRARVNKEGKTQFSDLDWVKATKYTDDTVANQVGNQLNDYKTANNQEITDLRETLGSFRNTVEGTFKDGIIAEYELKILKTQMQSLDREKADVDAGYNQLLNHPNLTGAPKTRLQTAYTNFSETHNNLTSTINQVISDGVITEAEYESAMSLLDNYPIALTNYKNVMNETYLHLIEMAQNVADGALDIAGRLDTWKSSSFEVDVDKIATRVGESSWETKWQPVVEQGINDAVDGIEVGGRNLLRGASDEWREEKLGTALYRQYFFRDTILEAGETYTFSLLVDKTSEDSVPIKVTLGMGTTTYQYDIPPAQYSNVPMGIKISITFTFTQAMADRGFENRFAFRFRNEGNPTDIRYKEIQLEKGTVATDWTEAPEDTEARIEQTNKELNDVKDSLSTFENTITTSFKDGIIETAEAKAINSHKAQLSKEKKDIDQKYTTIYANSRLAGTAKTNLLAAKTAFNTSHSSLISAIDKAIADGKATTAEYNTVISGFGDYEAKLATLTYRFEEANDYIGSAKATSAETNAKTHADTAAKNAKEAAEAYAKTKAEAERVLAEAHADGKVTAEENARIADVNARLKEAKTHADTTSKAAEDAAKLYADTEISKIEVGGRNLIPDSNNFEDRKFVKYLGSSVALSEKLEDGYTKIKTAGGTSTIKLFYMVAYLRSNYTNREVTLSFDIINHSENDMVIGHNWLATSSETIPAGFDGRYIKTGKISGNAAGQIQFNTKTAVDNLDFNIRNLKIEVGNVATDWTPAPEDIENQFKTINSNAYGLNEELTKAFKDGIISEAEATALGDSINLVKSDYENVMKRYANVYANTGLVGTAKTNLLSARNAYNTSYNALVNHITAVISSGKITNTQRATYNTLFSDYRVKIGVLSDAIESAWDAIVNKKSGDAASSAVTSFYNTEIKAKYSTTTQTKELLGSYVTDTELKGNLDKIATYATPYDFKGSPIWLREAGGSVYSDAFSYEITAKTKGTNESLLVVVLNSKGQGKGWDLEILEEKGTTGYHPRVLIEDNIPQIATHGGTGNYTIDVIYTKYAGSFTNLSKTSSMIEQKADEINLEVRKKVGNDEIISRINQSAEKISIDADRIELTSGSSIRLAIDNASNSAKNYAKDEIENLAVGARNLIVDSRVGGQVSLINSDFYRNSKLIVTNPNDSIYSDFPNPPIGAVFNNYNLSTKKIARGLIDIPPVVNTAIALINLYNQTNDIAYLNRAKIVANYIASTIQNFSFYGMNVDLVPNRFEYTSNGWVVRVGEINTRTQYQALWVFSELLYLTGEYTDEAYRIMTSIGLFHNNVNLRVSQGELSDFMHGASYDTIYVNEETYAMSFSWDRFNPTNADVIVKGVSAYLRGMGEGTLPDSEGTIFDPQNIIDNFAAHIKNSYDAGILSMTKTGLPYGFISGMNGSEKGVNWDWVDTFQWGDVWFVNDSVLWTLEGIAMLHNMNTSYGLGTIARTYRDNFLKLRITKHPTYANAANEVLFYDRYTFDGGYLLDDPSISISGTAMFWNVDRYLGIKDDALHTSILNTLKIHVHDKTGDKNIDGAFGWDAADKSSLIEVKATGEIYHSPFVAYAEEELFKGEIVSADTIDSYLIKEFNLSEPLGTEQYVLSLKGNIQDGKYFGLYINGGQTKVGNLTDKGNGVYSITFENVQATLGNEKKIRLYSLPNDGNFKTTLEWVKLEKGNKATDWSPAPEDVEAHAEAKAEAATAVANTKVAPSEIIPSINLDKSGAQIEGKQIDLIGDVSIVNGSTKLSNAIINTAHIDSLSFDVLNGGTALFGGNGDNGILEVRDEDDNSTFKMDSSQTAASHITIGELNVERINSPDIVKYSSEDMVFYVRGSAYGDDSNDGLTLATAFATFGRAIQEIPQIYDGICEIRTRTVREYEEVEIKGFSGKGKVEITGMDSTGSPSDSQLDTYAKFRILGNNIDVVLRKMHLYSDGGAVVQVDGASVSLLDINMTGNKDSQGLALSRNAFADWRTGEIFNVDRGVTVYYGSRAYLRDLTGAANGYGIVVAYAAMADISNFGVTGDSVNSSVWPGSYMGGSTNYPSAPKPKPAPTPAPVTRIRTFKSSSTGHYYVGASWGWNSTYMPTYPFQGKWGSVHMKEGAWFFGSTMRNTLQGKTIKKIRVSIGRTAYGSQGYTGRRKFTLRMHSHASMPSERPNMTGTSGTYTGTLSLGERRWFDVTSVFSSFIRNGSWYGFGVKTTSTSDYEYMAMMKSMTVEVTYED